jgi:hypothetical protein
MINHSVWPPVMDGPDFQVALEFAKRLEYVEGGEIVSL